MRLEEFFPHVLAEVPGCPDPTVSLAVLSTCIEFCRETLAWSEIQDPVYLAQNVMDYEIETPKDAYPLTVRDVWVGGRRLRPMTLLALQEAMPDWATAKGSEPAFYNSAVERGVIRVFPIPTAVNKQTLTMRAAFTPTLNATTVPNWMGQRHVEVIAGGAKGRLMLMQGTTWFNAQMGAYYKQLFDDGVMRSRIEEAHDRVPGSVTVQARSFGF